MENKVVSFQDLDVYKNLYQAMLKVSIKILPTLPKEERYGLIDQMRRACKAPLALLAEGYAQKNHKKEWRKYLFDAMGECNEMVVHLNCAKDLYEDSVNTQLCQDSIEAYIIAGKQLYRLAQSWQQRLDQSRP